MSNDIPQWALDKAANAAQMPNWAYLKTLECDYTSEITTSVIAHARMIAKHEEAPDPYKRERDEINDIINAAYPGGVPVIANQEAAIAQYKKILKERGL